MNTNYTIKLIAIEDLFIIIPFLRMLDKKTSIETLKERLIIMQDYNYQCVGVYDGDELIGISGVWILFKYYIGKHLEVDNVMIHSDYRGKGIGKLLLNWITNYGKSIDCVAMELNCYTGNHKGNKFWEEFGCEKIGYHYRKTF